MKKKEVEKGRLRNKIPAGLTGFLLVLLSLTPVFAQETPQKYQPPKQTSGEPAPGTTTLIISPDVDYQIGPSDVVDIKIEDAPELSGTFRLNAKGTIMLPVVGSISAGKKTTEEVAKAIADKLRGNYLVNPIVSVRVLQSNSRAFFIQGAVRRPGIYQIEGRPSLLKLITIAGGLADNYGSTAFVMREKKDLVGERQAPGASANTTEFSNSTGQKNAAAGEKKTSPENNGDYDLIKANINNLLRGNLEQNVIIQPGDIVHIPQTDVFFVAGEVKSPGAFPLKEGTSLRQAISLAQGTTFEGASERGIIFREDGNGARHEIKIDIASVMKGKKDDVVILPNDIIIVPNSRQKTFAKSLFQSFGSTLPGLLLKGLGVW